MMKRVFLFALPVLALTLGSTVYAAGYGAAGCGLGSMVFGDEAGLVQVFAATTNGTSASQLFGITSGTSNCDESGIILAEKEGEIFAEQNFDVLSKEMAAGEGEHLGAFATLLGCSSDQHAAFASYTQANYESIFASDQTSSSDMIQAVQAGISQEPALASCIH